MQKKKLKNKERLVLLDAHAIIHRAYHALPDFSSSQTGEPTGALYGLAAMLMKTADDLDPDYVVAAYDLPEPTHRHDAFDEYKAGRDANDEELELQIQRSRDVFKVFNIPIYEKPGFEADDIIGTIVEQTKKKKDLEVIIVSGDMDTLQLAEGDRVGIYTQRKGMKDTVLYDEVAVNERFGFGPTLIPDYKGLRGDPSDNIPGIPGVGEKTATALITAFGSLEDIYKQLKKSKEKFEEKGIKPRIIGLLEEHEEDANFSKMLAEIRRDAPIKLKMPKRWEEGVEVADILKLFRELGFRTLSERAKKKFGVSEAETNMAESGAEGLFAKTDEEEVDEKKVREVAIALWVLDSEQANASLEDILQTSGKETLEDAEKYIFDELQKQDLEKVFKKIEKPLIPIVEEMEARGVGLDLAYLKKLSKSYHKKLDTIAKRIYKHAGAEFNINSPKQLGEILFDKLGLSGKGKTATGRRSTREAELQKLADDHPIIEDILSYRELQKLLSTYIDNLPGMVSPADKRLHAHFLQHGTSTGRMSSRDPNMQNIPIRTKLGQVVRNAFIAEKGNKLLALDYSQIELRTVAILSKDKVMQSIFKSGGDIHEAVAMEVFGKHDKDARRKAKIINFGLLYGMGANALAKAIDAKPKEAREYLARYKEEFTGLIAYLEDVKAGAHKKGYTETLYGRRRYLPGLASHLPYVRAEAERMAINAPVQGTAADVIKIAMARADKWIKSYNLEKEVQLVLQVHDELVYEVEESKVEVAAKNLKEIMESVLTKKQSDNVPLIVDMKVGDNWGELEELS